MITKRYIIEEKVDECGKKVLVRTNSGFTAWELLGMIHLTESEIIDQIHGNYKPDVIKRNYVEHD